MQLLPAKVWHSAAEVQVNTFACGCDTVAVGADDFEGTLREIGGGVEVDHEERRALHVAVLWRVWEGRVCARKVPKLDGATVFLELTAGALFVGSSIPPDRRREPRIREVLVEKAEGVGARGPLFCWRRGGSSEPLDRPRVVNEGICRK